MSASQVACARHKANRAQHGLEELSSERALPSTSTPDAEDRRTNTQWLRASTARPFAGQRGFRPRVTGAHTITAHYYAEGTDGPGEIIGYVEDTATFTVVGPGVHLVSEFQKETLLVGEGMPLFVKIVKLSGQNELEDIDAMVVDKGTGKTIVEGSGEVVDVRRWRDEECYDIPPAPNHDEFWYIFTLAGVSEGKVKLQPRVEYKLDGGAEFTEILGPEFEIEVRGFADLRFDGVGEWGEDNPGAIMAKDGVEPLWLMSCSDAQDLTFTLGWDSEKIEFYTDADCLPSHKVVEDATSLEGFRCATFEPEGTWVGPWQTPFQIKNLWAKAVTRSTVARDIHMKLTDWPNGTVDQTSLSVVEVVAQPETLYVPAADAWPHSHGTGIVTIFVFPHGLRTRVTVASSDPGVFQFEDGGSPTPAKEVLIGPSGEAALTVWGRNAGVGSISAQVMVGTGQAITYSDVADVVVITVDLDVDADRDGIVENSEEDDSGEETWAYGQTAKGAIILCNNDDDDDDDEVDKENNVVDGTWDVDDLASLVIRKLGVAGMPPGWTLWLEVSDFSRIRIFPSRTDGATGVIGPPPDPGTSQHQVPAPISNDLVYGMEAVTYPDTGFDGLLTISLTLRRADSTVFASDTVQVRVAPWLMLSSIQRAEDVYAVYNPDPDNSPFLDELSALVWQAGSSYVEIEGYPRYRDDNGDVDIWPQDEMELGYSEMPVNCVRDVVFDSPRDGGLDPYPEGELRAANFGWFERGLYSGHTYNYGGNIEVSPRVTVGSKEYLFGRIIYGGDGSGWERPEDAIRGFLAAQGIQDPIEVDTTWLYVGHVDEVISFVPVNTARGFKVLMASPETAQAILYILQGEGKGGLTLLEGTPWECTVDDILSFSDLMAYNYEKQIEIDVITTQLIYELGLNHPEDIIEVPVLFEEWLPDAATALTANMVNLLAVKNSHLIIPEAKGPNDGGTDVFEQYVLDHLNPHGLSVHFVDGWDWYHIGFGEVHCGTNARRFPDPSIHWWEQE